MTDDTGTMSPPRSGGFTPLPCTADGIARAAAMLRAGQCVAFPTETVYGLGANALDAAAVQSIFTFKGRPLTDPLIVHVDSKAKAADLVRLPSARAAAVFDALATRFWPGPLTLVARACDRIPLSVTAGTGFVGVRVPAHPLAAALLAAAGVPVAAPSANRFGHVSPTRAAHVAADLGGHPIGIMMAEGMGTAADGQTTEGVLDGDGAGSGLTCGVGIESTVAKVEVVEAAGPAAAGAAAAGGPSAHDATVTDPPLQLVVFRRGGVSVAQLQAALAAAGVGDVPVVYRTMHSTAAAPMTPAAPTTPLSSGAAAASAGAGAGAGAAPEAAAARREPQPLADAADASAPAPAATGTAAQAAAAASLDHGHGRDHGHGASISGGSEAPGMLLSHYAPDGVITYLASASASTSSSAAGAAAASTDFTDGAHLSDSAASVCLVPAADGPAHGSSSSSDARSTAAAAAAAAPIPLDLPHTVVLDFAGQLAHLKAQLQRRSGGGGGRPGVLAYRDLSPSGDVPAAAAALFEALRWTETITGATALLIADPAAAPAVSGSAAAVSAPAAVSGSAAAAASLAGGSPSVDVDALRDRMFRAASGRVVRVVVQA